MEYPKTERVALPGFEDPDFGDTEIEITENQTDFIVRLPDWLPGDCSPLYFEISGAWLKREEIIKATAAFLKAVEEVN